MAGELCLAAWNNLTQHTERLKRSLKLDFNRWGDTSRILTQTTHLLYHRLQPPLWAHESDGSNDFGMQDAQGPVLQVNKEKVQRCKLTVKTVHSESIESIHPDCAPNMILNQ